MIVHRSIFQTVFRIIFAGWEKLFYFFELLKLVSDLKQ